MGDKAVTYKRCGDVKFVARENCEIDGFDCRECNQFWRTVVQIKDFESDLGTFTVRRCDRCGLGFTDPYPSEETAGLLYQSKNSADFDVAGNRLIEAIKDYFGKALLRRLGRGHVVSSVLDYGTGNGRFAVCAQRVFPDAKVVAVDYQVDAPPLLQHQQRIEYVDISELKRHEAAYDLIVLRHVLEHNHHPVDLLRQLAGLLSDKGQIYVEVPNLDSGCAKFFGSRWKNYYVPRHIFHYTEKSLARIVSRAGLIAEIGGCEMPLMGNTVAIFTGINQVGLLAKVLGIILHPMQLLIEFFHSSSTCLYAQCRKK